MRASDLTEKPFEDAPVAGAGAGVFPQALAFPATARTIVIKDDQSLVAANDYRNNIRALKAQVDEYYDPLIEKAEVTRKAAVEGKKSIVEKKAYFWDPLDQADRSIKAKISDYNAEVERQRMEALRAQERAREKARQIADEASDKAHSLIKNGELGEVDKVVDQATEKVEAILGAVAPVPEKIKLDGFKEQIRWYAEVMDVEKIPRKYMIPDMVMLNKLAVALKHSFDIPGVIAKSRKV
ncbi:MAG: hypothetical protein ABFC85_11500 [Rectinema sp.]